MVFNKQYVPKKIKVFCITSLFSLACSIMLIPSTIMAKKVLACVGNSITERGGSNGYVALIAKKLGNEYDVKNFGLSGRTMCKRGNHPYWKEKKFKELFELKPDIITLMLGTNDAKAGNWSKCKGDFEADASAMVDTLLSISSKPRVILALPPHVFGSPYSMSNSFIIKQVEILRSVAEKKKIEVIDAYTPTDKSSYFKDGCHPNNDGYLVLTDVFYNGIINEVTNTVQPLCLSKKNQTISNTMNKGVLNFSILPGKSTSYTIIYTQGQKSGLSKEIIFQLNGKIISK